MVKSMNSFDGMCNSDVVQDEKTSILAGACEYIEKLQRQVQELQYELDTDSACSDEDDSVSSCEDALSTELERPADAIAVMDAECRGCSHFTVGF